MEAVNSSKSIALCLPLSQRQSSYNSNEIMLASVNAQSLVITSDIQLSELMKELVCGIPSSYHYDGLVLPVP